MGAAAQQQKPGEPQRFTDGKIRVFLFVAQEGETGPALDYLARYADDPEDDVDAPITVRKVNEIAIDQLNEQYIVIPVVRDVNKDRREIVQLEEGHEDARAKVALVDKKSRQIHECKPVAVAPFYKRARNRQSRDEFDRAGFINAIAQTLVGPSGHALAAPRLQRRGDGEGNHTYWLVLQWG